MTNAEKYAILALRRKVEDQRQRMIEEYGVKFSLASFQSGLDLAEALVLLAALEAREQRVEELEAAVQKCAEIGRVLRGMFANG